jgi:hypothetical protein
MHSENKECRVRIKNAESVCTNIGALQTSPPPIKDTSTGLNMGKNKMNSKSRVKLRTHRLTGGTQ